MKDDFIIALSDKNEYMKITNIEKQEQQHFYKALILQDHFSQEFKHIIHEYWECVDLFSITLVDDLEEKIKQYNLVLQKASLKVFDIEFKDDYVTFFLKYPTSNGFLDDYPGS